MQTIICTPYLRLSSQRVTLTKADLVPAVAQHAVDCAPSAPIPAAAAAAAICWCFQTSTWYDTMRASAQANYNLVFGPGVATYTYPVTQRPAQLWYHDHV
jgi:hypothetical protein